ncbi:MAG: hypothetical protein ACLU4N_04705 [Butyricimonas faecihominis]
MSVIEDTAVAPERLPAYMEGFGEMLERLGLKCVYHAISVRVSCIYVPC